MQILQTATFSKVVKKLHPNQKRELDSAIKNIMNNPSIGEPKTGDLSGVFIHKFKMINQLALLAYTYNDQTVTLTLLALGSHENFYRDLKNN
jgi:mRNA-degrading endonuclease YafQ of YafQ-DinJ toxin-antitoxin module